MDGGARFPEPDPGIRELTSPGKERVIRNGTPEKLHLRATVLALAVVLVAGMGPAFGLDEMPTKRGWTGFIVLGVGGGALRSNTVAGSSFKEIGDAEIDSIFDEAGIERDLVPVITGELGYYFDDTETYVVLGNVLEDLVRYDFTTKLGVQQRIGGAGILAVDLLGSAAPARVYADPFLTGEEREATDRTSLGGRVTWDRIGGSGLEIELTGRGIRLDDEESGVSLGLGRSERDLLDREGTLSRVRVSHPILLGGQHVLLPMLSLTRFDMDGEAEANDRYALEIAWRFSSPGAVITTVAYAGRAGFDEEHPIFGETREDDILGLTVTGYFPNVFPSKRWALLANVGAYDGDSNIDFYNTRVGLGSITAMFRF